MHQEDGHTLLSNFNVVTTVAAKVNAKVPRSVHWQVETRSNDGDFCSKRLYLSGDVVSVLFRLTSFRVCAGAAPSLFV